MRKGRGQRGGPEKPFCRYGLSFERCGRDRSRSHDVAVPPPFFSLIFKLHFRDVPLMEEQRVYPFVSSSASLLEEAQNGRSGREGGGRTYFRLMDVYKTGGLHVCYLLQGHTVLSQIRGRSLIQSFACGGKWEACDPGSPLKLRPVLLARGIYTYSLPKGGERDAILVDLRS